MMYFDQRSRLRIAEFGLGITDATMDLGRGEPEGAQSGANHVQPAVGGVPWVYRRRMLEDIGFLDPEFIMIYEDVDLSFGRNFMATRAFISGGDCLSP